MGLDGPNLARGEGAGPGKSVVVLFYSKDGCVRFVAL